jgi:hypothetical protein
MDEVTRFVSGADLVDQHIPQLHYRIAGRNKQDVSGSEWLCLVHVLGR